MRARARPGPQLRRGPTPCPRRGLGRPRARRRQHGARSRRRPPRPRRRPGCRPARCLRPAPRHRRRLVPRRLWRSRSPRPRRVDAPPGLRRATRPVIRRVAGASLVAPRVSMARTANPSIAELSKAGTCSALATSSASTRPNAASSGTVSVPRAAQRSTPAAAPRRSRSARESFRPGLETFSRRWRSWCGRAGGSRAGRSDASAPCARRLRG